MFNKGKDILHVVVSYFNFHYLWERDWSGALSYAKEVVSDATIAHSRMRKLRMLYFSWVG